MAYSTNTQLVRDQVRVAVEAGGGSKVWAGLGAYRQVADSTVAKINAARDLSLGRIGKRHDETVQGLNDDGLRQMAARKRGANIYAELAGDGNSLSSYRITDSHPSGDGLIQAMMTEVAARLRTRVTVSW